MTASRAYSEWPAAIHRKTHLPNVVSFRLEQAEWAERNRHDAPPESWSATRGASPGGFLVGMGQRQTDFCGVVNESRILMIAGRPRHRGLHERPMQSDTD
jgi:hypothetical protein